MEPQRWNSEEREYVCLIALSFHKSVILYPISFVISGSAFCSIDNMDSALALKQKRDKKERIGRIKEVL